ncbi:MAG: hypothetical protein KC442_11860 [Thermomicrobiales bacterium]|nr:hypothetical protein [Thermomicrobiales bacterium]
MAQDLSRSQAIRTAGKVMLDRKQLGDFAIETTIGAMIQVPQRGARRNGWKVGYSGLQMSCHPEERGISYQSAYVRGKTRFLARSE